MIVSIIHNSKEEKEKLRKISKQLAHEAQYIGEEGDMCCMAKNEKLAFQKFRKLENETSGEGKSIEFEKVGYGWLYLPREEDKYMHGEDTEFYVSYSDKLTTDVRVWVYIS